MGRKRRDELNVAIIDIGDRGHAIGKTPEGEVVILYGGTVPGDVINMSVAKKKKGIKHGYVKEITSLSQDRVEPKCTHFGTCGGCKWQNLNYKVQATLKEKSVRQAIKRIAKDEEEKVDNIKAATKVYHYRNKLEYTFSTKRWLTQEEIESEEDFSNRSGLGFHISGAFDKVLDIGTCYLQDDFTNEIRNHLRKLANEYGWSHYDIRNNYGFLRNIILRNSTLGEWMITIIFGEDNQEMIGSVFSNMQDNFPQVTSWNYIINPKQNSSYNDLAVHHVAGTTHITERLGDISYRISPKSFFQTNSYQAKVLYDTALDLAGISKDDVVYDLYTGTGSIALYLARNCKKVIGIEVIPEAIEDAQINAQINKIDNATFLVGDVKIVLDPTFHLQHGKPDIIITDPPRAGMHQDVVASLLSLEAPKILYISCNPSTQARDILLLKEKYDLGKVVPVDMFPHTSHIESVAIMKLRG